MRGPFRTIQVCRQDFPVALWQGATAANRAHESGGTREIEVIDRARRDVLALLGGMAAALALRPPPLRAGGTEALPRGLSRFGGRPGRRDRQAPARRPRLPR